MTSDAFAIYHTWPDMRNAEYEVLQRVLGAAERIGKRPVVIDNNGIVIWAHRSLNMRPGKIISPKDVEFAISLHFESPRTCDIYTYYALWQPVEFYADFGYQGSIDKFSTHDDLMSCHSDIADMHAMNIFSGLGRDIPTPLPTLFHMLPEPYLAPRINAESSLFYVGINWERIGRPKGRFHDVLKQLDDRRLVKIYGPELIQGVAPWEGFKTYSGELPFDGASLVTAINECGICLALSSKAHQNSGIMSNRLFEGLVGGAAVIANPNAIVDKYFSDVVYTIDDTRGEAQLHQQIVSCLREIRNNPQAAVERVLRGQAILRSLCSLEGSLQTLFEQTPSRKRHKYRDYPSNVRVTVVLMGFDAEPACIRAKFEELAEQVLCTINLHVIAAGDIVEQLALVATGAVVSIMLHTADRSVMPAKFDGPSQLPAPVGGIVGNILADADAPYFALLQVSDMLMRDHFSSLARAIMRGSGAQAAVSGTLQRTVDSIGRELRSLKELRLSDPETLLAADAELSPGRALFCRQLLKPEQRPLLAMLDGDEYYVFLVEALLAGPLAGSNAATHLNDAAAPVSVRNRALSRDLQRQFIRDYYNGNDEWRSRVAQRGVNLMLPPTSDTKSHGRWTSWHTQFDELNRLDLNRVFAVQADGEGMRYLTAGFSTPEANAVWMEEDKGVIQFTLPAEVRNHVEDYSIILGMLGRRSSETGRMQHCTFIVNNIAVAYQAVPDFFTNLAIRIPLNIMRGSNSVRLEIVPDHMEPVRDASGNVVDARNLSVLVNSLSVMRSAADGALSVSVNTIYRTIEGEPFARALFAGFYAPERNVTWICGCAGEIQIRLRETVSEPFLHLRLEGRKSNVDGRPQTVTIKVAGQVFGSLELRPDAHIYRLPLKQINSSDVIVISVEARHAEPVLDSAGQIVDPRLLGVGVHEFAIFESSAMQRSAGWGRSKLAQILASVQRVWKGR